MLKKIALGIVLAGLIGILVTGAIIRTADKTAQAAEARSLEQGQGRGYGAGNAGEEAYCEENGTEAELGGQGQGRGNGQSGGQGQGQGGSQGQGIGSAERQYLNYEAASGEWAVYQGTVVESPSDGGELVIATDEAEEMTAGTEITVGTGPGFMAAQGFALQTGERVQVEGTWEGEELRATRVTRLSDGQSITLRDEAGRPAWAGAGRRAAEQAAVADQGQGQGSAGAPGTGQAEVGAWVILEGSVTTVDGSALVVETTDGEELVMDGRTWSFAQDLGFWAQVGDKVTLRGFYDGEEFEVGGIANETQSLEVQIRDESGRPLWAGGGRRGG